MPILFTSYAHLNRDKALERFVKDVADAVQQHLTQLPPDGIVFFDSEGIRTGEAWVQRLSAALLNAKACMTICTAAFLSSQFCGKELAVFLARLQKWRQLAANASVTHRPIFPVLWMKVPLPQVLGEFQYTDAALPKEYLETGLRAMYVLSKYAQKRKQVVLALAQRIAEAIQAVQLPPGDPIPHFDHIASALHAPEAGVRYAVAVVPLLANKVDEVMFGAKPAREHVEAACGLGMAHYLVEQDGQLQERLRLARDHHQIVVVVTTLKVLVDPMFRGVVSTVDGVLGKQSAILIGRPAGAPGPDDEVTARGAFGRALAAGARAEWISSDADLLRALQQAATALRRELVDADAPAKVEDAAIAQAAAENGIPVGSFPGLSGPAGANR